MDRAASIEAGFFPPPPSRRRLSDETNETSSSKKRDGKKWTLGGLFRRRKKKPEADAAPGESESSSGAEEERGGFLSKRRSRRDTKRKPKLVGTFDHVVMPPPPRPQQQQQHQNQQTQPQQHSTDVNGNLESSLDRLSARSSKESLSVVQHRRQESSGGSGSMDGGGGGGTTRRERREIAKARMEAQRGGGGGGGADSSSEDDADRRSPSVSTGPGKRTRGARTERYIARLHKSDGGSRDLKSATPSPAHSPSVRHRQPQLTPPTHHDAATCTFPPGKAAQYSPRTLGVSSRPIPRGPSPVLSAARSVDSATRRPWHGGGAVVSSGSHDNICAARTNISQHTSAPTAHADQRRSQSFDSNIHRASQQTPPEEVLVVQFPIARPHTFMTKQTTQTVAPPPPPPPRDPLRKVSTTIVAGVDPPRPMSYAFETGGGAGGSSLSELQYKPYFLHQQQQPLWASSVSYQRRSGSDNQIAAAASNGANPPPPRLQAPTPTRPRPSSVTPESPRMQQRNRRTPPPPQILQYYADQYPRSRRPIQLLQFGSSGSGDQPYLSDSQVSANSTPQQHFLRHPSAASDFWRQKELEASTNTTATSAATSLMRQRKPMLANTKAYHNGNNHLHANNHYLQNLSNSYHQQNNQLMHNQTNNHHQLQLNSAAHPLLQHQRNDRSRSNSPQTRDRNGVDVVREKALKLRIPAASHGRTVASTDSQSSLSSQSDVASPVQPGKIFGDANSGSAFLRPLSKVVENGVTPSRIVPPTPPVRRFSRQNSNSSLEVTEQLGRDKSPDPAEKKRRSTNLEEALSELEAIYNSLRLGDEDLLDRAERRDLPSAPGAAGWGRGAESDSGFSYGYGEDSELFTGRRRRAPPLRRAGVPDRVADDMAYRRLNPKDRMSVLQDARNLVSQSGSYLQAAPVLSSNDTTPTTPTSAPDVTFDDVLYRNIRHTNNTLKISDPQLPFGIPVGPVTAAAPSDYLHATPASDAASSYRPTFRPRKVPDVVKDDLAYRNLRKDPNRDSAALPSGNDDDVGGGASVLYYARNDDGNFTLRKKRAIRSLSANLMGFIHREPPPITTGVTSLSTDQDFEKAQSFADLPDAVQVAQRILEGKDVIGGGVGKFGRRLTSPVHGGGDRTPQQRFVADRNSVCGGTSTETLTDSRINLAEKRNSFQNRLRVFVPGSDGKPPVYVASPRASPSIMPRPTIEEGDSHMEDLLTAMAHEARATSEKLDLELKQLGREEKLRDEEPEKDAGKAAEAAEGVQKPVHQEAKDEEMVQENDESVTEAREDKANEEEAQAVAGVCEIRNISCDGSVLISEIVRRQRYHEEDDGKDQQVPEVSSDEEADLEVARATAGAGVRTWSLSGRLESPADEQTMFSKAATRSLGMGDVATSPGEGAVERMARYKEERRRQLASQFGARPSDASAPRRYITRGNSSAAADIPKVRTTRTSRLRAGNASSDTSPNTDSNPQDGAGPRTRRSGAPATRRPITTSSSSSIAAAVDEKPSTMSDSGTRREKDKSAKRKSNLNRCLTAEAVAADVSTDDSSVRRRRRPVTGLSTTPVNTQTSPTTVSESSLSPRKSTASVSLRNYTPATPKKTVSPSVSSPQHAGRYPLKRASVSSTGSPKNVPLAPSLSAEQQKSSLNSLASKAKLSEVRLCPRNVDNKTIDVCQRVEILTALTKESLARLDKLTGPSAIEECGSVNHDDAQQEPPSDIQSLISKDSDDISGKICSIPKRSPISVNEDSLNSTDTVPAENEELNTSPTRPTSSILKKKVSDCKQNISSPVPVSILKRKTSQDEAGSNSSCSAHATPVTFSPTVKENSNSNSRRQGILKKRASLDESEVMRRRSCSPDMNHSLTRANCEFRPILKNQRRSSMEELVRRTQSPDPQPHSILKRKASRDDESEERINASPEPQGILKRKSNVSSSSSSNSGSPHISISQSVIISSIPSMEFAVEGSDLVRPILKKKSSSEETNTGDSSLTDTPRPILKKKTSIDVEESDDRPKKPILKSKKHSQDGSGPLSLDSSSQESPTRCLKLRSLSVGDSGAMSDGESVKPILKYATNNDRASSPHPRLSFCNDEDAEENSLEHDDSAETYANRWNGKLLSPSSGEGEFSNSSNRRRLWDGSFSSLEVSNDVLSISVETENSDPVKTLSVAERVLTMENYIDQSRSESVSPTNRTGAVPKRLSSSRYMRDKDRFHTQPITQEELDASNKLKSVQDFQSYLNVKQLNNVSKVDNDESVTESLESREVSNELLSLSPSLKSDCSLLQDSETKLNNQETMELGLNKSSSVSAMASLFAQKQEEALQEANKNIFQKSKGSPGVRKYRERRKEWANQARVSTQPITQEEVEEAVRLNKQQSESREENNDVDDDDPSKLSLGERIRLFNQKIVEEQPKPKESPPPATAKRPARFRTQPVTTEEVETAQKKISNLAASFAKPPDTESLEGLSVHALREKMYEHGASILSKTTTSSHLVSAPSSRESSPVKIMDSDARPKGILKHPEHPRAELATSEDITETESEAEVKGILKVPSSSGIAIPELESFRHLKSVLKKETSTEEHSVGDVSSEVVSTTNDQLLRSILKPESTGWIADKNSTSSEDSSDSEGDKIQQSSRGRNSMDLVKMLHGVEAHAKQQRQANRLTDEQKLKNIKNLSQEKENRAFPVKTIGENDIIPTKKGNQHVLHSKIVEQKYLDQKLSPSKLLSLEKDLLIKQQQMNIKKIASQLQESEIQSFSSDNVTPQTSDGETSSGGREVKHIIRNEAVARRRQAAINRLNRSNPSLQQQQQLWKSRSQTSVPQATAASASASELTAPLAGVALQRSLTQPMPITTEDMSGASIADRLAALQKSGNNDWRKRISQMNPLDDLSILTTKNQLNELHIKQSSYREISRSTEVKEERKNGTEEPDRVGILADRLGMLDAATQGWKKRVGPTDAVNFSVAGRMMQQQHKITTTTTIYSSPESLNVPLPPQLQYGATPDKQKRTPRAMRFRSKRALLKDIASTPTSPQKENVSSPTFKRSLSAPGGDDENSLVSVDDEESLGPKVVIPRTDDETFSEFFRSVTTENVKNDHLEILDEDLDTIINSSSQLLVQKKTVKVQRRNVTTRNPIKALAARTDLKENYVEVKTGIAEKEIKRLNVEKLAKNSSLAVEALAGLASKEDFTAVALKKASGSVGAMLPYKDLMLLHIKGRRHVQTRLVEPVAASINRGDNYVLVTPTEVFNWVGHYSNVIERSRGAEVAQHIAQKKDLGYKGSGQVATINEDKITCSTSLKEKFWSLLGCEKGSESAKPSEAGHPDEDELYESCLIATNKVYEMKDSELVPIEEYWGSIPRIQMLDPAKILVFDLGSEMYIWNGKNASLEDRRQAQQLSRELWAEGYDYSGCDICPLDIASVLGCRNSYESSATTSSVRPSWALLAKVTQHMETVLFREKFLDWPDFSRVIRSKSTEDMAKQVDPSIDIKPCDVSEMLSVKMHDPDLELEGTHLGRGKNYYDEEMRRYYEISTLGVTMWHIQEYEHTELPKSSVGQFHSGDSYVVRWQYSITVTGRELNGQPSRHSVAGRDRCAYFCWQGKDASLNEQGAAALLTVELDHERGPQVRVVQGYEPPAFLNLFSGGMVVHSNKRNDDVTGPWRLFLCRGDVESEAVLVEVPCSTRQLRNRACFILVNIQTGSLFIWHGGKAPKHTRKVVKVAAENIKNKRPPEIGFSSSAKIDIYEQEEGSEKREFFQGLGGSKRQLYVSQSLTDTPRLFHLSSLSGSFCATEILGPYRNPEVTTAFPFLQEDLYNANQPGLFLLDSGRDLWLWQGWWPDSTDDPANQTGSGAVRWQAERRAAMQTALDYAKSARKGKVSALLVWAGLEPLDFTNLFPMWTDRDDIAELNIRDGKKPGEVLTVENELARLTRSTYPPAQLLQRPLPDGVDPTCLEVYLNPQHFQELLGMTKDEFSALPTWKQTKLKKDVGLF